MSLFSPASKTYGSWIAADPDFSWPAFDLRREFRRQLIDAQEGYNRARAQANYLAPQLMDQIMRQLRGVQGAQAAQGMAYSGQAMDAYGRLAAEGMRGLVGIYQPIFEAGRRLAQVQGPGGSDFYQDLLALLAQYARGQTAMEMGAF